MVPLYTALIIRKGLKEFLNYVSPLCNFHISTLGAASYGNEVKDVSAGAIFLRAGITISPIDSDGLYSYEGKT